MLFRTMITSKIHNSWFGKFPLGSSRFWCRLKVNLKVLPLLCSNKVRSLESSGYDHTRAFLLNMCFHVKWEEDMFIRIFVTVWNLTFMTYVTSQGAVGAWTRSGGLFSSNQTELLKIWAIRNRHKSSCWFDKPNRIGATSTTVSTRLIAHLSKVRYKIFVWIWENHSLVAVNFH